MHREFARDVIHERLEHWNSHFDFSYNRVSIKNQRRCWGSCSEKGNLNFNYRVIFLPQTLMDYVIVHELCHLAELNHSKKFWEHIARALPEYKEHRNHLKRITQVPATGFPSSVYACTQEVKTSVTLYPS
jgi:hypothetical protein